MNDENLIVFLEAVRDNLKDENDLFLKGYCRAIEDVLTKVKKEMIDERITKSKK